MCYFQQNLMSYFKPQSCLLDNRDLHFPIRQGNIGPDACIFQRFDVLDGAILGIPRHQARPQVPAKARAKDEVEHRLVIHHFRGSHQHLQNDPGFAAIDDIVAMIAQMRPSSFQPRRRGVRISRAHFC